MAKGKVEEITLPVAGMSCAACVNKVEKVLKGLPGVADAKVNLAAAKAGVEYDPAACSLTDMAEAVRGIGYEVPWDRIELLVLGMMGTHCQQNIEQAVGALEGVAKVEVNLGTDTVAVEYAAGVISPAQIKKTIRELGYEVSDKAEGEAALDRERQARQQEVRRQLMNLLVAFPLGLLVMLGTFRDYWVLDKVIPEFLANKYTLWALTTPVVLGPGRQFFVNSFNGLRRGLTDMNLLYATGIGAA